MAIVDRMIRASKGEVALYEEVEQDPGATTEALIVVAIVALAAGIGTALGLVAQGRPAGALGALIGGIAAGLVGWAVFAGVTYFIGKNLFHADATWEEVLRTLGYANSPRVASILGGVPVIGGLLMIVLFFWSIYLSFISIKAALDISTGQTIATILLSIIPAVIITAIILAPIAALGR